MRCKFGNALQNMVRNENAMNPLSTISSLGQFILTPRRKALHPNLTVPELVKKLPAFYGIRMLIAVFATARHWTIS
jgi:hypothetical protein